MVEGRKLLLAQICECISESQDSLKTSDRQSLEGHQTALTRFISKSAFSVCDAIFIAAKYLQDDSAGHD